MRKGTTQAVANLDIQPTADFIRDRNVDFGGSQRLKTLRQACGETAVEGVDASAIADRLLGDLVFSNMFLLGFAWQKGLAPVSLAALDRAIVLNGVAVDKNLEAFALGRAAAVDLRTVLEAAGLARQAPREKTLEEIVARRRDVLKDYQDSRYAEAYARFVGDIGARARKIAGGDEFARAVATNLFKLMAYKDEYEVGRLYADPRFKETLAREFAGDFKLKFHLAPPLLNAGLDALGRPKKKEFGGATMLGFALLSRLKFLRGTPFDLFGMTEERRLERRMIGEYRARIEKLSARLNARNLDVAVAIARLPEDIRGFGPVKLASIEAGDKRLATLLAMFESADAAAKAA
jgi:indolepyruvate ferredoxin oxidoreductase